MVNLNIRESKVNWNQLCQILSIKLLFIITLFLKDVPPTFAHIGQPCNILGICWPPNIHIYCDDNRICRCRPETPVVVGPHQCKRNKSHGDKCSSDEECIFSDNYSFCDSNQCNCISNHTYDPYIMKCIHSSVQQRSSFNVFYTMLSSAALWIILLLIALFISIPCCLAFLYHCICYERTNTDSSICHESSTRSRLAETGFSNSERTNSMITSVEGDMTNRVSSRHDDTMTRQSYELSCFDEPPPSYDEAVKGYQNAPISMDQRNIDSMDSPFKSQ